MNKKHKFSSQTFPKVTETFLVFDIAVRKAQILKHDNLELASD